jgi:hypothetical protein
VTFTPVLDTVLNLGVFAFIGVLVWLYSSAPTALGSSEEGRATKQVSEADHGDGPRAARADGD